MDKRLAKYINRIIVRLQELDYNEQDIQWELKKFLLLDDAKLTTVFERTEHD